MDAPLIWYNGDDMTTHDDLNPQPSAPLSWRDIYRAVTESEVRIVASINNAVGPVAAQAQDHEVRLRHIEQNGGPVSREALRQVTALGIKLDLTNAVAADAKDRVDAIMDRERGILSALSAGQKTLLLIAAIIGGFVSLSHLIEPFFTRLAS
jgi:hypothetical protein